MRVLMLVGLIVAMFGVILIYDARPITKKNFGFGDQNEATMGLKITGFIMSIIGTLLVMLSL